MAGCWVFLAGTMQLAKYTNREEKKKRKEKTEEEEGEERGKKGQESLRQPL